MITHTMSTENKCDVISTIQQEKIKELTDVILYSETNNFEIIEFLIDEIDDLNYGLNEGHCLIKNKNPLTAACKRAYQNNFDEFKLENYQTFN